MHMLVKTITDFFPVYVYQCKQLNMLLLWLLRMGIYESGVICYFLTLRHFHEYVPTGD